jgi:hypothetical protein
MKLEPELLAELENRPVNIFRDKWPGLVAKIICHPITHKFGRVWRIGYRS